MPSIRARLTFRQPVNVALEADAAIGARIADRVTGFLGSWRFLAIQTVLAEQIAQLEEKILALGSRSRSRSSALSSRQAAEMNVRSTIAGD